MSVAQIDKALWLYEKKDYVSAQRLLSKILKKDISNIDALTIRGNIFYQQQNFAEALKYYRQILASDSQNIPALINAANSYWALKDYRNTFECSQCVLRQIPDDVSALTTYGNAAFELEKYTEAEDAFTRLLKTDNKDAWIYNSLSQIYQKTKRFRAALEYGWQAVEVSGGTEEHHINFGYLLYETAPENLNAEIKEYAQKWLRKYGENATVNHMGNALLHEEKIERADPRYIQKMFDAFACDFDEILQGLEYRAPQLLAEETDRIYGGKKHPRLRIADIGCGTGFCGGFLKKHARWFGLYGIDISQEMLKKAKAKKCYSKLICADLETWFSENKKKFDLIVAADVLTYFGALENVFSGCCKTLSKNGRILFTASQNNIDDSPYYLHASGRFLHHENYLKKVLSECGFRIEKMELKKLRNEGENPVFGYVVSAIKS